MTINEQLRELRPHIRDDKIVEIFICVNNWANTSEGELYTACHKTKLFDRFLKQYGELKSLDWCILISEYYDGFEIGFVVDPADL